MNDIGILKELRLTVGGITILVNCPDGLNLSISKAYQGFLAFSAPDIVLTMHSPAGNIAGLVSGNLLFDSGGTWRLHYRDGSYIFSFYSLDFGASPYKIAVIDELFKSGDIYISGTYSDIAEPLEYPLDEILMISLLASGRGMMAHSCGASLNGEGFLFVGVSGSGKSTMAKILMKESPAAILNDDRTAVRKIGQEFFIYGTPWHGEVDACRQERAPLKKIFFIKHAKDNQIKALSPAEMVTRLIACSFSPFWDRKGMEFTLSFLSMLAQEVPSYELGFLPDGRVLELLRRDI